MCPSRLRFKLLYFKKPSLEKHYSTDLENILVIIYNYSEYLQSALVHISYNIMWYWKMNSFSIHLSILLDNELPEGKDHTFSHPWTNNWSISVSCYTGPCSLLMLLCNFSTISPYIFLHFILFTCFSRTGFCFLALCSHGS